MKLIKYILFFIIYFSFCPAGSGQNQITIDSLIKEAKTNPNDSIKYSTLRKINILFQTYNKDSVITIWNSLALFFAENKYYRCAGYCYYSLARELKNNGDYFESFENYLNSKKYYENIENKLGLAQVYNGLGSLYKYLDRPEESSSNYLKSAQLFQEINKTDWVASVFLNLGGMWEEQDSLKRAKYYLNKSKIILNDLNHYNRINCYINLGIVFNKEGNKDSAFYYFSESYKLSTYESDLRDKFNGNYYLGKFLFQQNEIALAAPFFIEAKQIAEDADNINILSVKDLADFYLQLSLYYQSLNDYSNAYFYLKESVVYETKRKITETNLKINRMVYENKTSQENKRRTLIMYISIFGFLGSVLLLFSIYRSYKHKKEANRLLTEMDELKNKLYSNITHELRTPLTLILGPLEQMLSNKTEKTPSRKQVKMMRKNANSLLTLVNQMLDLTKIDAKNMKLELVESDINKFLRTRFAAFASLADQKQITYNCSLLNEKNIQIYDASKLEKIINNLLSNAIKFTDKKGSINCYVNFHSSNKLELIIQDTGKGIPREDVNKVFNRFHQVTSNKDIFNIGTGIGLALTKELVDLMHGKIEVESETGKGTKFMVSIPLGTEHLNIDEYQMIQNLNSENSKQTVIANEIESPEECDITKDSNDNKQNLPTILIVEDNSDIREYIAESLSKCFYTKTTNNGKTGLKRAIKNIPDLVITDVVMPKMDGIELCNKLKTDERTSHIPVIMLTGKSATDDRLKGLENGADAYLTKPFNIKELALRVNNLIEQRKKLRERFTQNQKFEPKEIAVTSVDEKFITRAMEIIEKNISNSEFEVRQFQDEMFMSRMQLFRKIKALTNQTPSEFIRTIRLKRAAQLIKQNFGNIAQITFEVGFNNPSYFAKCFKDLFGELPSDYAKNHQTTG